MTPPLIERPGPGKTGPRSWPYWTGNPALYAPAKPLNAVQLAIEAWIASKRNFMLEADKLKVAGITDPFAWARSRGYTADLPANGPGYLFRRNP